MKDKSMHMNINREFYIKVLYSFVCKIYQTLTTIFENIILRKKSASKKVKNLGYFKYKNSNFDFTFLETIKSKKINPYLYVKSLPKKEIEYLIKSIFDYKFRKHITSLTGFEYSIDYMIVYDRKNIKEKDRNVPTLKQAYSYEWHFDKPNSSNMLKIIIPLNISKCNGPLKVIDKVTSSKNKLIRPIVENHRTGIFTGFGDEIYGFNPTLCIHKDGIPQGNKIASQIMFQLNPHFEWSINSNISNRMPQFSNKLKIWNSEPKFPLMAYRNDIKVPFKK